MGMSDLTVFVVADDERSGRVRATIAAWTAEGLADSSVWVTPQDVEVLPAGPPRVTGEHVLASERVTDDLFHIVGRRRLRTVRVVVGQLVGLDGAHDPVLIEAAERVTLALRDSLPRTTDGSGAGTVLRCLNVVVPVSGAAGVSPECLVRGWDANVVVSAEDRPDVDRASTYVRDPGNLAGHAATALAACGGVLTGIDDGVLDELGAEPSTSNGGDVRLLRVSVRAVVGQDMESRLAVRALAAVDDEAHGAGTFVEWGRLATDPERVVTDLTDHLLRTEPWASGAPAPVRSARQNETAPWDAIKHAVRFDVRMFPTVVGWVVGRKKEQLENRATSLVVGEGGDTVVRFEPASPDKIAADAARHLDDVDQRARDAELEREAAAVAFPDPSAWGGLRSVAFAAVDGGELPDDVPEPRYAGVREILAPGRVVPDVRTELVTGTGQHLSAADPVAVRTYRLGLDARIRTAQLHALEGARPTADGDVPVPTEGELPVQVDGEDAPANGTGKSGKAAASAPVVTPAAAEDEVAALVEERERLGAWLAGIDSSVLWKVADDVGRRRFDFAERRDAARERMAMQAPPHEALVRAKRRLTGWWYATTATWLLATLIAIALLATRESVEIWDWTGWLVGIAVVALVVLGVGNHSFYKAVRAYEWNLVTLVERRQRISEEIIFSGRESRRLAQLYGTLVDWIEIISWVLHHPTGEVVERSDDVTDDVVDTLPAAFGVARTATEDDIPEGTVVQAVRRLHHSGWASRDFDHVYESFRTTLASDGDTGFLAADLDTVSGPFGARRLLRRFYEDGTAAAVITERVVETLRRVVHEEVIVLPTRRVTRLGTYADDVTMPEPDFYDAANRSSTTFVADMFTPAGMTGRKHYTARSVAWLPPLMGVATHGEGIGVRRSAGDIALRADVSQHLRLDDLRLFTDPARPDAPVVTEPGPRGVDARVTPSGAVFH